MIIIAVLETFLTSYLPRMHIHPSSPNSSSPSEEEFAAVKIQANWKGYRVRKQLNNSRKMKNGQQNGHGHVGTSRNNSNERISLEEKSATKIQANWKGFKIRKELKSASAAATKIQASWKGFKTRKELKTKLSRSDRQ